MFFCQYHILHILEYEFDPKYFHSVEHQNKLRIPHVAKTHFFMKIEYNDLFYSSILFISRNSSFVISPLANLSFNALSGSSPPDDDDAAGAVLK